MRAEAEVAQLEAEFQDRMLVIPNLPHPAVPVGEDESSNVVVRTVGEIPRFDFEPRPHWELGPELAAIDFERGVKISGSRFYVLTGVGARLQRALINFMLDVHVRAHGYVEIYPPAMVKTECLVGTGNLPKFADTLYRDIEEEMWWVPTAEVTVTNLYREEILEREALPIRHVAYSPCFRREKMSAGRDVRGIKRGHQFDKVELVKFVEPETANASSRAARRRRGHLPPARTHLPRDADVHRRPELRRRDQVRHRGLGAGLRRMARGELVLELPGLPGAAREHPLPPGPRHAAELVHTLNGSGLAFPRVLIAVLETYQQQDGSVLIPPVLQPFVGTDVLRPPSP